MGKHLILIVDDEPRLLKSLSLLLKREFDIITASNGKEGYEQFRATPYLSLILLDLDMPVMNGIEMLKRVREISSKMKVIIMTGGHRPDLAFDSAMMNVQGYIKKPFDIDALSNKIKELLVKTC